MPSEQTFIAQTTPAPLCGNEPGSFAEDTLSRRLPGIARSLLYEPWHPQAQTWLQALVDDMPHGRLRPIQDPGAPDIANWQADLQPYLGQTWLDAPWFVAEIYFFRRILEATGYFQPGPGQGVDPYRSQKAKGQSGVIEQLEQALARLEQPQAKHGNEPLQQRLVRLFHTVVWGNRADLSVWPVGKAKPQTPPDGPLRAQLLVDDTPAAAEFILEQANGLTIVDFILDNVGLELAYDLLLADFLLNHGLAKQVRLHAKPFPTYVSDATIPDIRALVAFLAQAPEPGVRNLGLRLQACLDDDRLHLQTSLFWTSPLPAWEMPPELRQELARGNLLISKGDANYRRWLGDRHWPFITPVQQIIAYHPAPLLLMRVMKAEIVAGLQPGQPERLYQADPTWLFDGRSGLIQFVG
jgi:uncharacterized protein with ATP-grasp and redox domains